MKKKFFYLAASALALTACTSENVVDDAVLTSNAIGFENVVNKSTRADLTKDNLELFQVYGYYVTPSENKIAVPVFQNVPVRWNKTRLAWEYDGQTRYWLEGEKYYFYAYSCGSVAKLDKKYGSFDMNMDNGVRVEDRVLKINGYLCDNTHQHDLIFATNTGATETDKFVGITGKLKDNDKVSLQFNHILSKVRAQFTSQFPADYTVKVSEVRIGNIYNQGDYHPFATEGWINVKRLSDKAQVDLATTTKVISPEGEIDAQYITTSSATDPVKTGYAYVIPKTYGTDDTVTLAFHIVVENKGEVIFSKDMYGTFNPNWDPGYTYVYDVKLDGNAANLEPIVFTTVTDGDGAVVDWEKETTVNFSVKKD